MCDVALHESDSPIKGGIRFNAFVPLAWKLWLDVTQSTVIC
jgi:hypothetical protein